MNSSDKNSWDFDSGSLPLDFANTVEWHASQAPEEHLQSYSDLVDWAESGGLLSKTEANLLRRKANAERLDEEKALAKALKLREGIYRTFSAIAQSGDPDSTDLNLLNDAMVFAAGHRRLDRAGNSYRWHWNGPAADLDRILWPIADATAALLTSDDLVRVGQCADDRGCGWLFIDTSRNHSRRWCSMESCGNRAKAKRHYQRQTK